MDPQLLEYRRKQRECFLVKAEAPAPTKLVELLLAAEAAALPQTSFHGVDNATLDAVAKAMWEGSGEQSILNMLLPDSDDEDLVELVQESPPKRSRPAPRKLSDVATETLKQSTAPPGRLLLLSWNSDGLDSLSEGLDGDLARRTTAVCELICQEGASVVLLQEVVEESLQIVRQLLDPHYYIHVGRSGSCCYFVALLLQKGKLRALSQQASFEAFPKSGMGRGLLSLEAATSLEAGQEAKLQLFTSHLESMKSCAEERERQFAHSLQKLATAPADVTCILGGDLNLRDEEARRGIRAASSQHASRRFVDAWEACGSQPSERLTWDPNGNDNGSMTGTPGSMPRCRFDRLFLATPVAVEAAWRPVSFRLVGRERLRSGRFASDHWGILAELQYQ